MPTARTRPLPEQAMPSARARRMHPKALALLDVLIGMALFVLIAIIAVYSLAALRARGYVTGAIEDAKSLGTNIEASTTALNATALPPTGGIAMSATTPGDVVVIGPPERKLFSMTNGNVMTYTYRAPTATDEAGFTVCVKHYDDGDHDPATGTVDAFALYDSRAGGIVDSGTGSAAAC